MFELTFVLKDSNTGLTTAELEYFDEKPTHEQISKMIDNYNEMGLLVIAMHENRNEK